MEENCEIRSTLNIGNYLQGSKRKKNHENKVSNFHAEILFFSNIENKRVKYNNSQMVKCFKVI